MKWYGALHRNLKGFDILSTSKTKKLPVKKFRFGPGKDKQYLTLFGPYYQRSHLMEVLKRMRLPIVREYNVDMKSNPAVPRSISTDGAVEIYDQIHAIEAKKGKGSLWPKENFRHDFTKKDTRIYGLKDGSILIRGKQKLWKNFKYPSDVSDYG